MPRMIPIECLLLVLAACSFDGSTKSGTNSADSDAAPSTSTDASTTTTPDSSLPFADASALEWWDTSYGLRLPLVIEETAADLLPDAYSVVVTVDTATLVGAGQMQLGGQDLRIVRWDGNGYEELDRRLIQMNSAATKIWFRTRTTIDVADSSYSMYYGNSSAGAAPAYWSDSMGADAPSNVYLAADNFQEHNNFSCPDGWGDCGSKWEIEEDGDQRYLTSSGNGLYLLTNQSGWSDVHVEAAIRSPDPYGCPGIATRALDSANLVYTGYYCSSDTLGTNLSSWSRIDGDYTPFVTHSLTAGTEWHRVAVAWTGNTLRLFEDDVFLKEGPATNGIPASGRVGFFSTYNTELFADDMVVRKYVNPEPTVMTSAAQTAP